MKEIWQRAGKIGRPVSLEKITQFPSEINSVHVNGKKNKAMSIGI